VNARARSALGAALLAACAPLAHAAADRTKPPSTGSPRSLRLPPIQKLALASGLPVILAETREVPTVEVLLVIRTGAASDPQGRAGLAAMTADMLDEGAGGKDALTLADALDLVGAELTTSSSWDASVIRMHVPSARLSAALPLMADVALRPSFRSKDLDRLRKEYLTSILQARDDPAELGALALAKAVFGEGHRYGFPVTGDARSIATLRLSDLRTFHTTHYKPGNAALIVAGDADAANLLPLLEKVFGPWRKGGAPPAPVPDAAQVNGRFVWLVDRPGSAQSVIRIGRVGPPRVNNDYHALEVMNTLLGGSFTSRLNDNLREQHGYAYRARSGFDYRRAVGVFAAAADVQTASTADALSEFLRELQRIRSPASKEEVERARNYLAFGYAEDFETTRQIAGKLADQVVYGLLEDEFTSFVSKVQNVDARAVQRAAEAEIDTGNMAIVVVGDREKVERGLRTLGLGQINVLSVDQLMGPPPRFEAAPGGSP
jgi:predicted Zn-dependent peptidase